MAYRKLPTLVDADFIRLVVDNDAPCIHKDPEIFYPNPTDLFTIEEAKAVCKACPVVIECLKKALASQDQHAILGATTPDERWAIRKGRRLAA